MGRKIKRRVVYEVPEAALAALYRYIPNTHCRGGRREFLKSSTSTTVNLDGLRAMLPPGRYRFEWKSASGKVLKVKAFNVRPPPAPPVPPAPAPPWWQPGAYGAPAAPAVTSPPRTVAGVPTAASPRSAPITTTAPSQRGAAIDVGSPVQQVSRTQQKPPTPDGPSPGDPTEQLIRELNERLREIREILERR